MNLLIVSEPGFIVSLWRALFFHHLSTTTISDGIMVLEDGLVVDSGDRGYEPSTIMVCVGRKCKELEVAE